MKASSHHILSLKIPKSNRFIRVSFGIPAPSAAQIAAYSHRPGIQNGRDLLLSIPPRAWEKRRGTMDRAQINWPTPTRAGKTRERTICEDTTAYTLLNSTAAIHKAQAKSEFL